MTRHSERERAQRHWRPLRAGPLCDSGGEQNSTVAALRLQSPDNVQPGCDPKCPPPLAHPQPRYLSSTRKHPLSRFTGYLIVDLLVVDSHSCCCSHSCIVSPLCSAPMTSVSPCTIPQTRPTKLALMKGQDDKQRIRHAKQ